MTPTIPSKRLAALEATREVTPRQYTPDDIEAARLRYEALLEEPCERTPQQAAYYATRMLKEIATDYEAMFKRARRRRSFGNPSLGIVLNDVLCVTGPELTACEWAARHVTEH